MLPWPKCLLLGIIKERHLYSRKNFRGTVENCGTVKIVKLQGRIPQGARWAMVHPNTCNDKGLNNNNMHMESFIL